MNQGTETSRPTRRHWYREVQGAWRDLTSMFRSGHNRNADDRSLPKISQFRLVVALFAIQYARHWPEIWNGHEVAALVAILFALPMDTLMARIPATEALGAVTAFFGAVSSRAAEKVRGFRSRAPDSRKRRDRANFGGTDPIGPQPPDGAVG